MMVRVFADSFSTLKRKDRVLVYHLARAVLAGRDIVFDQMNADGLEIRILLECVLKHNLGSDPDIETGLSEYLHQLWMNWGNYDNHTRRKQVPAIGFEPFEKAVGTANAAGAEMQLVKGEPMVAKLSRLRKPMFDQSYQPILASHDAVEGMDILAGSQLNMYNEVTMRDLARFDESYPHNSRLIRIDGHLVEEVYESGHRHTRRPAADAERHRSRSPSCTSARSDFDP